MFVPIMTNRISTDHGESFILAHEHSLEDLERLQKERSQENKRNGRNCMKFFWACVAISIIATQVMPSLTSMWIVVPMLFLPLVAMFSLIRWQAWGDAVDEDNRLFDAAKRIRRLIDEGKL